MPIIASKTPLMERSDKDWYPTQLEVARMALIRLGLVWGSKVVLDAGAGTGVWGEALKGLSAATDIHLMGVDIRELPRHEDYDEWHRAEFLSFSGYSFPPDVVIGNPPYNLAEAFIRRAMALLCDDGYCYYLFRLTFASSIKRVKGLFREFPPISIQTFVPRPSFNGTGKTDADEYAMFLWRKGHGVFNQTSYGWIEWERAKRNRQTPSPQSVFTVKRPEQLTMFQED